VTSSFRLVTDSLGLHRQNELTVKEPFRVTFGDMPGGQRIVDVVGLGSSFVSAEHSGDDNSSDLKHSV
jgi:hypothetical protein